MILLVYVFAGLLMGLGALYLVWLGQKQAQEEAVSKRLAIAGVKALEFPEKDWLTIQLERAGITLLPTQRRIIALALAVFLLLVGAQFGIVPALILGATLSFFAWAAINTIYQRRMNQIITQLPRLLDQVVRMMRTGKTLADSFFIATKEADEPLRTVMLKLQRNITLGMSIPEAFNDLADTYDLKELQVLALGVSVNSRFGGSLIDLLNNIITLIQQREQLQRQLRAFTGETRTSAAVLSALPLMVGGFMIVSNPDYLFQMVDDPTGKIILMVAAGMQVAGMGVIWKMLRSV
ncbi:tight adherence protein B [Paraperlucidibaca baekdonensis]|uniref:Tight adherence protein B n=1 Tax=Paraperlucidibaca baekdonensis TaxID=748120 RepID=A0A3E0H6A1_9GAMM|nr:type II secretion system F family protein [Paraperlucidibaca baekdonensis]REH39032.1 tight adherence protein B [Paraperlucidibaca baekdonensis]